MRDAFLSQLRGRGDAPVPWFFSLCQTMVEKFAAVYGHTDYRGHYRIPLREVFLRPTRKDPLRVFRDYLPKELPGAVTEWGIVLEPSSVGHFFHMRGPLERRGAPADAAALPLPDLLEEYRWEGVAEEVRRLKDEGFITFPGIYGSDDTGGEGAGTAAFMDIFESTWYLRGLDLFLSDLLLNPEFARVLLDRVTELKVRLARQWAAAGVDILITADDLGTQTGLMMSLDMYREWFKPRLARVIDAAKSVNPDILVFYHSDGNILPLIPDLIDAGVEILNPLQPECMDVEQVIKQYGGRLSFWGGVGTQTTLPFGSARDVCAACGDLFSWTRDICGLVLAPTHLVEPEVPLENVEALVDAALAHNRALGYAGF